MHFFLSLQNHSNTPPPPPPTKYLCLENLLHELLHIKHTYTYSISNSQWRVLNVSSINSVRHRMAWKIAANNSDKESDRSLLGTSSLLCWPVEACGGALLCSSLLTLVGDAIITTECGNCSLPLFTSVWWLSTVCDSQSDPNNMSSSLTDISEAEPWPQCVCLEAMIMTECWFVESWLQLLPSHEVTTLWLDLICNQVIILLPSCVTITLTSSAAEDWAIIGEVSLLTLDALCLSAVINTCKEENRANYDVQ